MDKLLVAQRMERDPEKREKILCQIARLTNEDVPLIYRGGRRYHVIARPEVKGLSTFSGGVMMLSEAWISK